MSDAFTTSQTIGPFFHDGLHWATEQPARGEAIALTGVVYDGARAPIVDAMLEFWSPAAAAGDAGALAGGWRRVYCDDQGRFSVRLPARTGSPDEPLAWVTVFARGLLKHQFTAVFDPGTALDAEVLAPVPPSRRQTLIARDEGAQGYRWDVVLQGDPAAETVFFDYR